MQKLIVRKFLQEEPELPPRHYFIATYFNYCRYEIRKKLTQEFCNRYPQVHLIQVAFDGAEFDITSQNTSYVRYNLGRNPGFIDYQLINNYIKSCLPGKWRGSLTILDTDLVLQKDFFYLVEKSQQSEFGSPIVMQCFSESSELIAGVKFPGPISAVSTIDSPNVEGHTGYAWSFSNSFIDLLGPELFPEDFVVGGFDYILWACLFKKKEIVNGLCRGTNLGLRIGDIYNVLKKPDVKILFIETEIIHCFHGDKRNRNTPWHLYPKLNTLDLTVFQKIVDDYFNGRKEFAPIVI